MTSLQLPRQARVPPPVRFQPRMFPIVHRSFALAPSPSDQGWTRQYTVASPELKRGTTALRRGVSCSPLPSVGFFGVDATALCRGDSRLLLSVKPSLRQ